MPETRYREIAIAGEIPNRSYKPDTTDPYEIQLKIPAGMRHSKVLRIVEEELQQHALRDHLWMHCIPRYIGGLCITVPLGVTAANLAKELREMADRIEKDPAPESEDALPACLRAVADESALA